MPLEPQTLFNPVSRITSISWMDQLSNIIGSLGTFPKFCMGSLKNQTGIMIGSNCNQIRTLKESHQDQDTITVR